MECTKARALDQTPEKGANIEPKSSPNPQKIVRKSTQIAPGGHRGDLGRFGGLRGRSRDALGCARGTLATLPARLGRPPDTPGTPRSDQKVRLGGPESTFWSVLFGQSFARRSRDDFRTFLGHSGEARTSDSIAPASVLGRSSVFRRNARSTTKSIEKGSKMVPRSLQKAPRETVREARRAPNGQSERRSFVFF